jgi:hypothetical protein
LRERSAPTPQETLASNVGTRYNQWIPALSSDAVNWKSCICSQMTKDIASPFSTGSGGPHFEARIQAAFTALMLSGGFAPCNSRWPIKRIKLQGKYAGYDTDDLIVFLADPASKREIRILAQVKHSISITESDDTFAEVIQAAWNDFNNAELFTCGVDCIALITGPITATDMEVRAILEWARFSDDARDFLQKVDTAKFSSNVKREKLRAFKTQLKKANSGNDLNDEQLWTFLKSYHLLGFDLDIQAGVIHSLLHSLIHQFSENNAPEVWALIVDEVQLAGQNAGTVQCESLSMGLRNHFARSRTVTIPSDLTESSRAARAASEISHPAEFAKAALLGGWSDSSDADQKAISEFVNEPYADWIKKMRESIQER